VFSIEPYLCPEAEVYECGVKVDLVPISSPNQSDCFPQRRIFSRIYSDKAG
jgi:hypothetical protein